MKHYDLFPELESPCALALGYFDGVHLGHRAVIGAAVDHAKKAGLEAAVFTFTLAEALSASRGGDILSGEERSRRIQSLGIQHYICPSTDSFYGKDAVWFVQEVLCRLKARAVFCGEDFTFGSDRAGVERLRELCAPLGIEVYVVDKVMLEGEPVSSTRIRKALKTGRMELANRLLGEEYVIDFEVVHGKQLGRTIGCPTINQLYPPHLVSPLYGVYITSAQIDGRRYPAATGFGTRPTVGGEHASAETYIEGFSGDLYGQRIRTTFYRYLCPQVKFDSLDDLARLIHSAARQAEQYFAGETL